MPAFILDGARPQPCGLPRSDREYTGALAGRQGRAEGIWPFFLAGVYLRMLYWGVAALKRWLTGGQEFMEDQTQIPAAETTQDSGTIQPTQGSDTVQASTEQTSAPVASTPAPAVQAPVADWKSATRFSTVVRFTTFPCSSRIL